MLPKIQILSNTNYPLSDVLKSVLIESTAVRIAVAFVRQTGIDEIYKSLEYAMSVNNAAVELIAGLDFKTTDAKALLALKEIERVQKNFKFYCFGDKRDNHNDLIFHPKIYLFNTSLSKNAKFTSVIGSSNLTGGGLTSNFEINSVFREDTPKYYSQLSAIYDEIKYTDSVFCPTKDYILKYGNLSREIEKSSSIGKKTIQEELFELKKEEQLLPGTVPSLKKIMIDFIKSQLAKGEKMVTVKDIYANIPKIIKEQHLSMKMDTLENTIRGELNKHEAGSKHKDNMALFKRVGTGQYVLTERAMNYGGR